MKNLYDILSHQAESVKGFSKTSCLLISLTFLAWMPIIRAMNTKQKKALADLMRGFHLPRYAELPNGGLYLKQTEKYINDCLAPLGNIEITSSMIRNYVKQGLVENPVQKLYYAEQIGYLICITILKHAAPLECIQQMLCRQRKLYSKQVAYDYFCMEMENVLFCRFGLTETTQDLGVTSSIEKEMFRSAITAVSNMIYLNACFKISAP